MEAFTIDFGENGVHTFASKGAIEEWLNKEVGYWSWIEDLQRTDGNFSNLWTRVSSPHNAIRHALGQSHLGPEGLQQLIRNQFEDRRNRSPEVFHSGSAAAQFISSKRLPKDGGNAEDVRNSDRYAALMLAHALDVQLPAVPQFFNWMLRASLEFRLWQFSLPDASEIVARRDAALSNLNSELAKTSQRFNEATARLDEVLHQRSERTEKETIAHATMMEAHKQKLDKAELDFKERLSLDAPVELWNKRHDHHSKLANNWGFASAAAAIVTLGGLMWMASLLIPDIQKVVMALPAKADGTKDAAALVTQILIAAAAKFAVIALLATWALRIVVRNYLSHAHLAADASERAAVIESFLAMSTDEKLREIPAVKEKGLPMALERAFARTQDGIVKDDALPTTSLLSIGGKVQA